MRNTRGPSVPFRIDPRTGSAAWTDGADKVREDLMLLLGIRYGERPMLRDYGANIAALVHEPDDDVTRDLLRRQVHEAVLRWEPRVVVDRVQVDRAGEQLRLLLDYVLADAPVTGQMIVPLG